jgi:hypothetical protein
MARLLSTALPVMRIIVKIVGIGLLGGLTILSPPGALAKLEVSASLQIHATTDFEAPLSEHGHWQLVGPYGRCWRPAGVSASWRPYCNGSWVWTDCGWYWSSDEPWAWACYHYGSWTFDSNLGWVWVPDLEWSPAWVHWRVGGGFVGWAPCPPRGAVVAPSFFAYVPAGRFHEHIRPSTVVLNEAAIINKTTPVTGVKHVERDISGIRQKVFINEGPGIGMIEKASGKNLRPLPVQEAVRQTLLQPHETHGAVTKIESSATGLDRTDDASAEPGQRKNKGKRGGDKMPPDGKGHGKGKH